MIVDKSTINPEETIDLDGPNGNALYLIGYIHKVFSFKPNTGNITKKCKK